MDVHRPLLSYSIERLKGQYRGTQFLSFHFRRTPPLGLAFCWSDVEQDLVTHLRAQETNGTQRVYAAAAIASHVRFYRFERDGTLTSMSWDGCEALHIHQDHAVIANHFWSIKQEFA